MGLGVEVDVWIRDSGTNGTTFGLSLPAGILIPLSDHVAVDIGLFARYERWVESGGVAKANINFPHVGVRAFF